MDESASHTNGKPPGVQPRPQLTKQQRRELQEKQKADKAAKAAAAGKENPGGNSNSSRASTATAVSDSAKAHTHKAPRPQASNNRHRLSISSTVRAKDVADSVFSGEAESVLKELRIFSHFATSNKSSTSSSKVEIHPSIIRLALQFSEFRIVGANARCIAAVTALKEVIRDYTTPTGKALSRDIMSHISPQINHLVHARPLSTSMASAIRQLKAEVTALTTFDDLAERDAKKILCDRLDSYIRDRVMYADVQIAENACEKIQDNSVICTFAKSSVVEKSLLHAHSVGKKFTVRIVDSGPLFEGRRLLHSLTQSGIRCTYSLITALGSTLPGVDMVLLGAHSLYANGALYSRAGTALVAALAASRSIPVLACCETYKFSNGVPFDGFTKNELAPTSSTGFTPFLQTLNPLYDLTPATAITAVITEVGLIPPASVPTVLYRAGIMNE